MTNTFFLSFKSVPPVVCCVTHIWYSKRAMNVLWSFYFIKCEHYVNHKCVILPILPSFPFPSWSLWIYSSNAHNDKIPLPTHRTAGPDACRTLIGQAHSPHLQHNKEKRSSLANIKSMFDTKKPEEKQKKVSLFFISRNTDARFVISGFSLRILHLMLLACWNMYAPPSPLPRGIKFCGKETMSRLNSVENMLLP